jgi:cell division protein FtsQ
MKKFLQILFFTLFAAGIVVLTTYVYIQHINSRIGGIKVKVARPAKEGFVEKKYVFEKVKKFVTDTTKIKDINFNLIEKELIKNPWVENADAFTDIEGNLVINISEVSPVLRVFSLKNSGFYLDENGNIIPLSKKFAPRVMVVNGYIKTKPVKDKNNIYDSVYKNTHLRDILLLTNKIKTIPFLNSLIGEIYLNSLGRIDLVPAFGCSTLQFGDINNLEKKLENILIFYDKGLKYEGWNKYKTINIEFENQIVCTKN